MENSFEGFTHDSGSNPQATSTVSGDTGAADRRRMGRMAVNAPAIVRGTDGRGRSFQYETFLDNVSANGLFVRLERFIEHGSRLFVLFPFPTASLSEGNAARVAVRGIVRRTEQMADGSVGAGISFQSYRLV